MRLLQLGGHLPLALALGPLRAGQVIPRAEPRLLQLHRRVALRARLRHLHVGTAGSAFFSALLGHRREDVLELLAQFGVDRLRAPALGVARARQERPAPACADDHRAAALLAVNTRVRRLDRIALGVAVRDELALRVRALHVLLARLALLEEQVVLLALRALDLRRQRRDDRFAVRPLVHGRRALRRALAGEEHPEAA